MVVWATCLVVAMSQGLNTMLEDIRVTESLAGTAGRRTLTT